MSAVMGDLVVLEDPNPSALSGSEFFDFDIAAVGGGFHHFADPSLGAKRLVERLRPGGVLMIWDFYAFEEDESSASHGTIVHGFSEEGIREIFEKAGAGKGFAVQELEWQMEVPSGNRRILIARGEKV
jgi:SAM-dependent methyltransferase